MSLGYGSYLYGTVERSRRSCRVVTRALQLCPFSLGRVLPQVVESEGLCVRRIPLEATEQP